MKPLLGIACIFLLFCLTHGQELEKCRPSECGRYPNVEPALCVDGVTISGVGPCVRNLEDQCEWLVNECPEVENELEDSFIHPIENLAMPNFFDTLDADTLQVNPCIRSGCNNEICSIDYIDTECTPLPEELNLCLARARCRLMADNTCGFSPDCYELHNYPRPEPTPVPTPVPVPTATPLPTKRPDSGASPGQDGNGAVSPGDEAPVTEPPYDEDEEDTVASSTAPAPSPILPVPLPPDDDEGTPATPPDGSTVGSTGGHSTGATPGSATSSVHLSPLTTAAAMVAILFMLFV